MIRIAVIVDHLGISQRHTAIGHAVIVIGARIRFPRTIGVIVLILVPRGSQQRTACGAAGGFGFKLVSKITLPCSSGLRFCLPMLFLCIGNLLFVKVEQVAHRRTHLKILVEGVRQHGRCGRGSGNHHETGTRQLETIKGNLSVVLGVCLRQFDVIHRSDLLFVHQKTLAHLSCLTFCNSLRHNMTRKEQNKDAKNGNLVHIHVIFICKKSVQMYKKNVLLLERNINNFPTYGNPSPESSCHCANSSF